MEDYKGAYDRLCLALSALRFHVYDPDDGEEYPSAFYRKLVIRTKEGEIELAEEYPYGDEQHIKAIDSALNHARLIEGQRRSHE